MPRFSKRSNERLATCRQDLQCLFHEVIKHFDCTIICGYRSQEEQERAFMEGKSKLRFPDSKHNQIPSLAVDVAPYDKDLKNIDWQDIRRMYLFAGFVLGVASQMGIDIRWGGDWDSDTDIKDNSFNDLVHFEIEIRDKYS